MRCALADHEACLDFVRSIRIRIRNRVRAFESRSHWVRACPCFRANCPSAKLVRAWLNASTASGVQHDMHCNGSKARRQYEQTKREKHNARLIGTVTAESGRVDDDERNSNDDPLQRAGPAVQLNPEIALKCSPQQVRREPPRGSRCGDGTCAAAGTSSAARLPLQSLLLSG